MTDTEQEGVTIIPAETALRIASWNIVAQALVTANGAIGETDNPVRLAFGESGEVVAVHADQLAPPVDPKTLTLDPDEDEK